MMRRVLFAGALVGLPFLVSSAVAQTPAIPAASSTPSAAPAGAAKSARPGEWSHLRRRAAPAPATPDGLVSPFLPAPDVATPPAIGAGPAPSNPPPAAAPAQQRRRPPRLFQRKPRGAEAEEGRSAPAAARNRALRRPRTDASARHLLRHRQGVRTLCRDRRRRRLADRHRRARPGDEGPGGRKLTQAPCDRGRSGRKAGERPGVGRRADGGGETLPVAHGAAPDRGRGRRDAEGDQRSGVGPLQPARLQRQPLGRAQFFLRPALCRGQSALDLGRGDRERARRLIATSRSSATPSIPRPKSRPISRSSTSTRPGRSRPRSSRRKSFPECSATPAT